MQARADWRSNVLASAHEHETDRTLDAERPELRPIDAGRERYAAGVAAVPSYGVGSGVAHRTVQERGHGAAARIHDVQRDRTLARHLEANLGRGVERIRPRLEKRDSRRRRRRDHVRSEYLLLTTGL